MTDDALVDRLDKLIAITQLVHKDEIASARVLIREDKANAAILDTASDWTAAGTLKTTVMQKSEQSKPTVERRIAALVDQGLLDKRGSGGTVSYRTTGLV